MAGSTGQDWGGPEAASYGPAHTVWRSLNIEAYNGVPKCRVSHLTLSPIGDFSGQVGRVNLGPLTDLDITVVKQPKVWVLWTTKKEFWDSEARSFKITFENFSQNLSALICWQHQNQYYWVMTDDKCWFSLASLTWNRKGNENLCKYIQESCLGNYLFHLLSMLWYIHNTTAANSNDTY